MFIAEVCYDAETSPPSRVKCREERRALRYVTATIDDDRSGDSGDSNSNSDGEKSGGLDALNFEWPQIKSK